MSWNTVLEPAEVERTDIDDRFDRQFVGPARLEVMTHYIRIIIIPTKKEWENFAENINEDVIRKLGEVDNHWLDLPDGEEDDE